MRSYLNYQQLTGSNLAAKGEKTKGEKSMDGKAAADTKGAKAKTKDEKRAEK